MANRRTVVGAAFYFSGTFAKAERLYAGNAWLAILTSALTPISYRTSAWVAGAFGVNFGLFVVASIIGRPIRFLMMAALVHFFGERARHIIERHLGIALLARLWSLRAT